MENIDNGSVPSDGTMEQDIDVSNTVNVLQAVNRPETGEKAPDKSDAIESDTTVKTESGENLDTQSKDPPLCLWPVLPTVYRNIMHLSSIND